MYKYVWTHKKNWNSNSNTHYWRYIISTGLIWSAIVLPCAGTEYIATGNISTTKKIWNNCI